MPNTVSSFYQTVVAAAVEASQLLAPTWKLSQSIFWDYRPEQAALGQTLNIAIPNDPTSGVTDAGVADVGLTDIAFTTQAVVYNKHPYFGYVVRDFEQFNSPTQIRRVFMDAALKGIHNNINAAVAGLFVTGNFTTNAAIPTTVHTITVPQFLQAMGVLATQNVPVANDPLNMSLVLHPNVYVTLMDGSTTGGQAWNSAMIAGDPTAEHIRQAGEMPTAYGMTIKMDQQIPATVGTTYTGAYFHRWAIAGVTRPLPEPDMKVVDYTYINFGNNPMWGGAYGEGSVTMPIRVMVGYNQYPKQGYIVSIDAGYGLKVVRENMCQLFTSAQ